jgi:hypothetical protein
MKYNYVQLIVISGIVFLTIFYALQLFNNIFDVGYIPPDSPTYIESADLLCNHLEPHSTRPIGYALVLGIPYLFTNKPSLNSIIIYNGCINLILWIATILVLFNTLKLFASNKTSFAATCIFIICVGNIAQIGLILTETLTTFILTLTGYFFFKYTKNYKPDYLAWAVGLVNILVLIKPGMIYWALTMNIVLIPYLIKKYSFFSLKIIYPVILSLGIILIQSLSIYQKHGNFTISYIDKITWYYYLGAEARASVNNTSYEEERLIREKKLSGLTWEEKYDVSKDDLKYQIKNNPGAIGSNYILNIIENSFGYNLGIKAAETSGNKFHEIARLFLIKLSQLQNVFFTLLAVLMSIYIIFHLKILNIAVFYSLGSAIYIILTSGISFWQGDRFHLVFYPIVIIVLFYILSVGFRRERFIKQ